ncbi:MAG TPA: PHP domain-containing protein [bacterium]|nr:PHP domain-containing protein [bacterium]
MTNSEIVAALERWSYDPRFGPRAERALRRAARRLLMVDGDILSYVQTGQATDLPQVGPFVARIITELIAGTRPPVPETAEWPDEKRTLYAAAERSRGAFLSLYDAGQIAAQSEMKVLGDLQMHTTWSDGADTPEAMAKAADALGYRYIAITDHSFGLRIARGMSLEALRRQRDEIKELNHRIGVRVFSGIEANVLPTGALDVEANDLAGLEVIVASCHSALRKTGDQTARLIAAVTHPQVHILGHPRGRVFGMPRAIQANWSEVFAAAAAAGTAIEINAYPDRQDVDYRLAAQALAAGCILSLGTDSHAAGQLPWMVIARAQAVLARAGPESVLNTWDLPVVERWLRRKRAVVR